MSIVTIDLHQLNVKTTSRQYKSATLNTGQPPCQLNASKTRRTTTRNIRFPNQMIEQINVNNQAKEVRNFSAWVVEACRRRLTSGERGRLHQLSDEE